ncbi:hypothetical protein ACEN85_20055, partial [Curtobacterium sp. CT11-45]
PVTVSGNGIGLLGDGASSGSTAPATGTTTPAAGGSTSGSDGTASGTQVSPVVSVPVTVSGNGIGLLGDGASSGSTAPATG